MDINQNNWQSVFINFILIGIILLLLFRIMQHSLPVFIRNSKKQNFIKRQLPVIEISLWFIFLSWFTFLFAQMKELYSLLIGGILFILLFWFSRFYLKEFIAGIIFKSSNRYKKGDILSVQGHQGKIIRFGHEMLELETGDRQIIFIPYSKLVGDAVHVRSESPEKTSGHSFSITTAWQGNTSDFEKSVQAFVFTLPWASINKPAQVNFIETVNNLTVFNVTLFLIDRDFAITAENAVRSHFNKAN